MPRKKSSAKRPKGLTKRQRLRKTNVGARVKALQDSCARPAELAIVDEMEILMRQIVDVEERLEQLDAEFDGLKAFVATAGDGDMDLEDHAPPVSTLEDRLNLQLSLARLQSALTAKHRILRAEKRSRSEADLEALRKRAEAAEARRKSLGLH